MKRMITGSILVLALVFTANAWSQEPPMERGKMGMGKMRMEESSQMKSCMGEMEMGDMEMEEMQTSNAAIDQLLGRMQAADGAEKMAAIEELLTTLVAQQREMQKMAHGMPKKTCGGMMEMIVQ